MTRENAKKRAEALVSQMTVAERASQLRFDAPAIERLGVPEYNWWNEALHGLARGGTATSFPQAIGLAAMFDDALLEKIGAAVSTEARAKYNALSREGDRMVLHESRLLRVFPSQGDVALDVKTAPERYSELQAQDAGGHDCSQDLNAAAAASLAFNALQAQDAAAQKIVESIKIVSAMPSAAREFRTVLYPPLVGEKEIKEIAKLLPKDARWFFAHFLNGRCLSAAAEKVQPYTEEKEAALVELARSFIPGAELR